MAERAYSLLHIKSVDAERRILTGVATSPKADRMGDIVEPLGVIAASELPLLLHHDAHLPVGTVRLAKPTKDGVSFEARIPKIDEPPSLKDRVDSTWSAIKSGLLKGVSIGFRGLEQASIKETGGIRFLRSEILELSLVTIPANSEATILSIKTADLSAAAASGTLKTVPSTPGATGSRSGSPMTISEQLTAEKTNLQVKSARLDELELAEEQGTLDDEGSTERADLIGEIKTLTAKVDRLATREAAQASMGHSVVAAKGNGNGHARPARIDVVDHVKELPKGTLFTRYAMAVAAGRGSLSDTLAYAKRWDGQTPQVTQFIKAVQGTASSATPGWGSELVNPNTMATEFVELLMPATIIGRVPGFRKVPFNIPIITQTGGSTFAWVGEAGAKPVGELAFTRTTLPYHKVAGIVVLTEELVRLSTPAAEEAVRRDMIEQCANFLDEAFIQIAKTAGANNPASITNGVTAPNAGGTTLAFLMADLNTALGTLTAADLSLDGLVIVTTPEVAVRLSLMVTTLGVAPNGISMTPTGGTLLGYPVIVSNAVDADTLVIFKPSEIFLASDDRVTIDASNQATLDMAGGTSPTFSLWQRNCVGLRAEQWITWQKRRTTVVAIIDTIAYVPGT